ncbi:uncharacterized protein BJ212DRAFT_1478741 [Suillus subaureus]|uniref:Uncharacterized protein n=1 Tax=Suillus subaureus TaxID=48587 RepID=A0A9P7JFJ0_9AGAM|nr:uncharacterized protein BJ212DRAFT_1478741 [Suillus subaureus]KAG1819505.1 hypothetical protein BJ212DRAFT_1478741 [Suillus subaureus]
MFTVIARRVPLTRLVLSRGYTSSVKEGSVAQSKGFSRKLMKARSELLRKLKAEIEAKKEELARLQEKHDEVNSKQ